MTTHSLKANPFLSLLLSALLLFLAYAVSVECLAHQEPESISSGEFAKKIQILLTPEEKQWIQEHKKLRIAGPKAFPPFFYYDAQNEAKGMGVDYTTLIMNALGIEIDIQRNLPWPQVLKMAKNRDIDLIALIAKTEDREVYLNYSQAYLSFPMVIVSRQNADFIGGQNDLFDKKVACVKGTAACEWLENDLSSFHPVSVDTPLKALETVAFGKADAFIDNLAAASYQIQKNGLTNLKIAAPTNYGSYDLYFGARKDWPILISILNKSLSSLSQEQQGKIRNNWLSVRYEHGIQASDVLKWLVVISVVLLLPVIVILVWNRRLKLEIKKREEIANALQESEKIFSAIFHHSPVAVTISSQETGKYLDINEAVTTLTGYTREDMIGHTAEKLDI